MKECSICGIEFDPEDEGIFGEFGMIPVAFCATCVASIVDMVDLCR